MHNSFEEMLIERCAPTLAGVKPANLFRCADDEALFYAVHAWNERLRASGIRIRVVKRCRRTHDCLVYVCRWDWICRLLEQPETRDFLRKNGYDLSGGGEAAVCQLSRRLCMQQDFPHEIGVFLGYPLRDVIGFIRNKGKNYTCCGHWKCYGDAEEAQRRFAVFRYCTELYQRMYRSGVPLLELVVAA
ncbi:MAG TPA: DUF3793 domain-containing protein [Clostridiales bacterium]|nr:DUF3793 domain-containing protein [Clostridiales bacterium]